MKSALKKHVLITAAVKQKIEPLEIVFPSQYGKLYAESARSQNIELNPNELLDAEMLNEKVVHHVLTLSSCAEKAIKAIENEDKKALNTVLAETNALRDEIHELQRIVYEDTLTKSYNRKWFEDTYLDKENNTLRTDGIIAIIDLNKFKTINDTFGHLIGDKVLIHIAGILQNTGGNVIRYGGDEFLVIFDGIDTSSKIKKNFDEMLVKCSKKSFKVEKESFKVSFAYGIAHFNRGTDLNTVIDMADKAMYHHKNRDKHS